MTHTLLELTKMSEEQLRSLGEELHIKKANEMDLSDLSMSILDEEAKIASKIPDPNRRKEKEDVLVKMKRASLTKPEIRKSRQKMLKPSRGR